MQVAVRLCFGALVSPMFQNVCPDLSVCLGKMISFISDYQNGIAKIVAPFSYLPGQDLPLLSGAAVRVRHGLDADELDAHRRGAVVPRYVPRPPSSSRVLVSACCPALFNCWTFFSSLCRPAQHDLGRSDVHSQAGARAAFCSLSERFSFCI